MQDDSYADAEEEGKRREHEMKVEKGREVEEKESRKTVEEKGDGGDLVEERKEEGGLKSIEAIAIKLVSSAEQGRRGSREEPLEKEEEMEEEDVGTDAKTDVDGNTNENVFRCSNAILKALPPASEPVLLSAGCNPGRKSV